VLRLLRAMAEQQPAVEPLGRVLHPLPRVHRLLASPACLPHLAQVNRIHCVLFGMHNRTFGPYLVAAQRILFR
jgi:hypothetical protein